MTDSANPTESDPGPPSYDDINTPMVLMVGVISSLLTLITIWSVQGLFYQWKKSELSDRAEELARNNIVMPAVVTINKQKKLLDGGDGVKSIDIAMKEVIATYSKPEAQPGSTPAAE